MRVRCPVCVWKGHAGRVWNTVARRPSIVACEVCFGDVGRRVHTASLEVSSYGFTPGRTLNDNFLQEAQDPASKRHTSEAHAWCSARKSPHVCELPYSHLITRHPLPAHSRVPRGVHGLFGSVRLRVKGSMWLHRSQIFT